MGVRTMLWDLDGHMRQRLEIETMLCVESGIWYEKGVGTKIMLWSESNVCFEGSTGRCRQC